MTIHSSNFLYFRPSIFALIALSYLTKVLFLLVRYFQGCINRNYCSIKKIKIKSWNSEYKKCTNLDKYA